MIISLICAISCQRDEIDQEIITEISDPPKFYHDSHFKGIVSNENGSVLDNVFIEILNNKSVSSISGNYILFNTKTNRDGALVKFSKNGYFIAFDHVKNQKNNIITVNKSLKIKKPLHTFNSSNSVVKSLNDNLQISIPAGSFEDVAGNLYTGIVELYFESEDYSFVKNSIFPQEMKMQLKNLAIKDVFLPLDFYIEFTDGQGKKLHPIDTNMLQLTLTKVPKSWENKQIYQGELVEIKELWSEINNVDLTNSQLTIPIKNNGHFRLGPVTDFVNVKTSIKSGFGQNLLGLTAELIDTESSISKKVLIDQNGQLVFSVIPFQRYTLNIKDLCDKLLASTIILVNNSTKNVDLNEISIEKSNFIRVKAKLNQCDEQPITINDFVTMEIHTAKFVHRYWLQSSNVDISIPKCEPIKTIKFFRLNDIVGNINISSPSVNEIDLNSINICIPNVAGQITIDGHTKIFQKSDFFILRESGGGLDLTISDLQDFSILIKNVTGTGFFDIKEALMNLPILTDCAGAECSMLKAEIFTIGNIGEPVLIKIEGHIGSKKVNAFFNNVLFN